jgi:hypothetical protein
MNPNLLIAIILVFSMVCPHRPIMVKTSQEEKMIGYADNPYPSIGSVPPPVGFTRIPTEKNAFASCRKLELPGLPFRAGRVTADGG